MEIISQTRDPILIIPQTIQSFVEEIQVNSHEELRLYLTITQNVFRPNEIISIVGFFGQIRLISFRR